MEIRKAEISSGELVVLFIDECHLLWGDICGYVWGKSNQRIEVPVVNQRQKQTYYGALNLQTQRFLIKAYDQGNSQSTTAFLQYLRSQYPQSCIALIWDGAGYHKSDEFKEFLASVNDNHQPDDWQITCILFAPNAPEQNPVEDVWLQAKNFLRKFWPLCKSFSAVKWLFKFFTNHQQFDFPKLHQYAPCS